MTKRERIERLRRKVNLYSSHSDLSTDISILLALLDAWEKILGHIRGTDTSANYKAKRAHDALALLDSEDE